MKKQVEFLNIGKTQNMDLCTGCGTCVGMCPNSAIEMYINSKGNYVPHINNDECNQCGICFETCPGHTVDFKQLNSLIFGKSPENKLIGNYINCYIGHSTDKKIRWSASSGGLITTLLIFALEKGIIDGALVTRMSEKNPLEPEVIIARTKEEIISASGSKYCPVPANIALKEILKGDGKFAVVGLPCHIHGIRKAEMLNEKLKEKVVLHLGLFCGHTVNFLGTEFILQKINIKKEEVVKLTYRGNGWPGGMSIELKNGDKRFVPSPLYWGNIFGMYFFTPTRDTLCSDGTCELADISFGDAWLPELEDNKIGESIIISRSKLGEKILQSLISERKIELNKINADSVVQSQSNMLRFKKESLKARFFLFKLLGKNIPVYNSEIFKPKFITYLKYVLKFILLYLRIYISSKRYLWRFIKNNLHSYNQ